MPFDTTSRPDKPYRIIYSLSVELDPLPDDPPHQITQLIIPLDGGGMSLGKSRPRPPKSRAIDLRVGDEVLWDGRWRQINAIEAYRDNWCSDEDALAHKPSDHGYIVRHKAR